MSIHPETSPRRHQSGLFPSASVWCTVLLVMTACSSFASTAPWDGSRTVPVHRLPLTDEDGQRIVPVGRTCAPLSQKMTCGACHDYKSIASGWHFNAATSDHHGRPGEPWVLLDASTGTQLPLSHRGGQGVWKPDQVGLDAWQFTRRFARHMPGGGIADPADLFEPNARWNVSGPLEVNCLACHNHAPAQDNSEWARQVGRENFRWAATAAAGLGEVGGMATRLRDSWTTDKKINPDDSEYAVPPNVRYLSSLFDSKNRMVFDLGRPLDRNCLACHSATHKGAKRTDIDQDVHTRAGISCVDCHRNGMDHSIVRGYEGEKANRAPAAAASTSCRGCHMGTDAGAARFGAQKPAHRGLPAVHLEKLSCTACHSGLIADNKGTASVRTSRLHRIGIHGRALWDTTLPPVSEPVFAKGHDGKITPHRAMWPAFWARCTGDDLVPLLPETVKEAGKGIFDPGDRIVAVLKMLAGDPDAAGVPVLVTAGLVMRVGNDGHLSIGKAPAAQAHEKMLWAREVDNAITGLVPARGADGKWDDAATKTVTNTLIILKGDAASEPAVLTVQGKRYRLRAGDNLAEEVCTDATAPIWGRLRNGTVVPLVDEVTVTRAMATTGTELTLTEDMVAEVLKALAKTDTKDSFAYIADGKRFSLGADGTLAVSRHAKAEAVLWPLAHDVRPARQALGAKGCGECHGLSAPFFNAPVLPSGPLATATTATPMSVHAGLDGTYASLFSLSFVARPLFKLFLFGVAICLAAALALVLVRSPLATSGPLCSCSERWFPYATLAAVGTMALLALTGFIPMLLGSGLTSYTLLVHNALGGAFAASLAVMALLGLGLRGAASSLTFSRWLLVAAGLTAILTAVTMMLPWQGTDGMHVLANIHRIAAATAVVAGLGMMRFASRHQPTP